MDNEIKAWVVPTEMLIKADSLLSLIGHRGRGALNPEVEEDMRKLSGELRAIYEGRAQYNYEHLLHEKKITSEESLTELAAIGQEIGIGYEDDEEESPEEHVKKVTKCL